MPETTNNVVNYDVIINAANTSGKLLPGMTANVSFVKQKKDNILVAPSAALRFTPTTLSAAEIKKTVFLAGLGSLTAEQLQAASASYDAAQKAIAAGKAPAARSGISSLMSGGRVPGAGGFGGPPGANRQPTARPAGQANAAAAVVVAKKTLWYIDDAGKLAVTLVEPGLSDGLTTELVGADSLEGKKMILKIKAE